MTDPYTVLGVTAECDDDAIRKRYLALVRGRPRWNETMVRSTLIRDRGDGLRGSVEHRRGRNRPVGSEKTQHAVTHVEVIDQGGNGTIDQIGRAHV